MKELKLTPTIINNLIKDNINIETFVLVWMYFTGEIPLLNYKSTELLLLGYIDIIDKVTKKGTDLLEKYLGKLSKVPNTSYNFAELHSRLQNEMVKLTGKKQKMVNGKYSFICNSNDLKNTLSKVIKTYNLTDMVKIEKLLVRHIQTANKVNFEMIPLLQSYISKDNASKLATDYENYEDLKETKTINSTVSI
jgi:hypothetical protein